MIPAKDDMGASEFLVSARRCVCLCATTRWETGTADRNPPRGGFRPYRCLPCQRFNPLLFNRPWSRLDRRNLTCRPLHRRGEGRSGLADPAGITSIDRGAWSFLQTGES